MKNKHSHTRRSFLKTTTCAFAAGAFMTFPFVSHAAAQNGRKILTVYFSHTNNTKTVAEHIHSIAGGDIVRLQTVNAYPADHGECVRVAGRENKDNARPELSTVFPDNMNDYDIVFAGYPVWHYTIPMALFTFFDRYKFAGKTVIPFSTHLGSHLGGGPRDIARLCPQATILEGLAIRGPKAAESREEVRQWLGGLEITGA